MTNPTTDAAREGIEAGLCSLSAFNPAVSKQDHDRRVGEVLDTYAAAVSRARDAAWREAVEAVRRQHDPFCAEYREDFCTCGAYAHNAALDALMARMVGQ